MFQRILFATDFSAHAAVARDQAWQLAKGAGKRLWVLTVIDPDAEPLSLGDEPPGVSLEDWEEMLDREDAEIEREESQRLAQETADIEADGIAVTRWVRAGDPADTIDGIAREIDADLIVIGSHGHQHVWDVLMGGTAERVARSAPCPVLIVSHQPPHPGVEALDRHLLATDFSPHAQLAGKLAISLAQSRGENKKLWALTVIEPGKEIPLPPGYVVDVPDQTVEELDRELRSDVEAAADERLDELATDAQAYGVTVETLIRHGDPAKEILKAAIDIEADMIIIGSHSRHSLLDKLMGDTPAAVTKRAPCPVLVVSHLPSDG